MRATILVPVVAALIVGLASPVSAEGPVAPVAPPATGEAAGKPREVDDVAGLRRWLGATCRDPILERAEILLTVRFSLRVDGSIFGGPVLEKAEIAKGRQVNREALQKRAMETFQLCLPVPLTPRYGREIAGKQIMFRLGRLKSAPIAPIAPDGSGKGRDLSI